MATSKELFFNKRIIYAKCLWLFLVELGYIYIELQKDEFNQLS